MLTCDRCLCPNVDKTAVVIKRFDGSNKQGRTMINATMDLCNQCITDLLQSFGHFKVHFLAEGDIDESSNDRSHNPRKRKSARRASPRGTLPKVVSDEK